MKKETIKRMRQGHRLLYEATSIKWLLIAIVLLIAICYCSWMSVHYHLRHYTSDDITSKPLDYLGLIAGFFALLVTLLVGWQIYSTIKAKEELQDFIDKFENRISFLEDCCKKGTDKLDTVDKKVDSNNAEQNAKIDKSRKDLADFSKSTTDLALASLYRQTYLLWEGQLYNNRTLDAKIKYIFAKNELEKDFLIDEWISKTPYSSDLFNICFYRLCEALRMSNNNSVKDAIPSICDELLNLTRNVLNVRGNKEMMLKINLDNIENVYIEVCKIPQSEYDKIKILENLEEIRNLRLRYENE